MDITNDIDTVHAFMQEHDEACNRDEIDFALGFSDESGMYGAVVFYGVSSVMVPVGEMLLPESAWHAGYILPGRSWVRGIFQAVYQGGFARYAKILSSTRVDNERANDLNVQMGMQIIETQHNPDGTPMCHTYSMTREQCLVLFES